MLEQDEWHWAGEEDRFRVGNVFDIFDDDHDGKISLTEITNLAASYDKNKNKRIT